MLHLHKPIWHRSMQESRPFSNSIGKKNRANCLVRLKVPKEMKSGAGSRLISSLAAPRADFVLVCGRCGRFGAQGKGGGAPGGEPHQRRATQSGAAKRPAAPMHQY